MNNPHKHRDVIRAWADGATIQARGSPEQGWRDCINPMWYSDYEYRVKPEPKPDSILLRRIELLNGDIGINAYITGRINTKFTFDGETRKLKSVEMINND